MGSSIIPGPFVKRFPSLVLFVLFVGVACGDDKEVPVVDTRQDASLDTQTDSFIDAGKDTGDVMDAMDAEVYQPRCGDGLVEEGEACDDGNGLSQDGCSSSCTVELPMWREVILSPPPANVADGNVTFDANRAYFLWFHTSGTWVFAQNKWRKAANDTPFSGYVGAKCVNDVGNATIVCYAWDLDSGRATTRIWDGVRWHAHTAEGPPARLTNAVAYDPIRARVVLYGGMSGTAQMGTTLYTDTWEWDGKTWTLAHPTTHPAAHSGALAYDPSRGKMMFAEQADVPEESKLWAYDGAEWTHVVDSVPQGKLFWDPPSGKLVVQQGSQVWELNDTWETSTVSAVPPNTHWATDRYVTLTSLQNTTPPARDYQSVAYDAHRGELMLLGGGVGTDTLQTATAGKTWFFGQEGWREGGDAPSAVRPALAFDPVKNEMIVYSWQTDVWNGASWSTLPGSLALDAFATVSWDGNIGALIRTTGKDGPFQTGPGDPPPPLFLETHKWTGTAWELMTEAPTGRWLANATWDTAASRTVLAGGLGVTNRCCEVLNELWEFDGMTWAKTNVTPSGRTWDTLTYDPHRGSVLNFGGTLDTFWSGAMSERKSGQDWVMVIDGPELRYPTMAFHALYQRTLVWGDGELWEFGWGDVNETCVSGLDGDHDGLVGCEDPDCWGRCTPECPPNSSCSVDADRCGDGTCNPALESPRLCPQDCGSPTAFCGDFICDLDESIATCPGDCR